MQVGLTYDLIWWCKVLFTELDYSQQLLAARIAFAESQIALLSLTVFQMIAPFNPRH